LYRSVANFPGAQFMFDEYRVVYGGIIVAGGWITD